MNADNFRDSGAQGVADSCLHEPRSQTQAYDTSSKKIPHSFSAIAWLLLRSNVIFAAGESSTSAAEITDRE